MHRLKLSLILLSILFCSQQLWAQYTTVQSIPNPKNQGNFFVSNPSNIISAEEEEMLERKLQTIERESTIEIAMVIVNSVEGTPKTFATDLFNYWGIGKANKNNGLLILVLKEQRRIEFITGYGIEQVLTDQLCVDIQQEYIVPYFKQGDYALGLKEGINEVYRVLSYAKVADGVYKAQPKPLGNLAKGVLAVIGIWLLISLMSIFSNFLVKEEPYIKYKRLDFVGNEFWLILPMVLIIATGIGLYFLEHSLNFNHQIYGVLSLASVLASCYSIVGLRSHYRHAKRNCPKTGNPMSILDESEEDAYLAKGQITEEKIKSKQYDVWVTNNRAEVLVLQYKGSSRKYSTCSKCRYTTNYLKRSVVTSQPTYHSSGSKRHDYECKHCQHHYSKTVILAMLVENTTNNSSSSGRSWGSGSSGGGGGSFGGGSSGGSGGGSSW